MSKRPRHITDEHKELLAEAVRLCGGTQTSFARALGTRQQTVSKLTAGEIRLSGEWAAKIDMATNGAVPKERLRPDLFVSEPAQ